MIQKYLYINSLFDTILNIRIDITNTKKDYLLLNLFLETETRKEQSEESIANTIIVDLEKFI